MDRDLICHEEIKQCVFISEVDWDGLLQMHQCYANVGGIPEIIENGVNGLLHPPQDPEALADIIEWVFTKPAKVWEPMRSDDGWAN